MKEIDTKTASPGLQLVVSTSGNAVDLPGHLAIKRRTTGEIDPASRVSMFDIGLISDEAIEAALYASAMFSGILRQGGLIEGAALGLCGRVRIHHPSVALLEPA